MRTALVIWCRMFGDARSGNDDGIEVWCVVVNVVVGLQ